MPALGDVVLYVLDETDAAKISAWRANFRAFNATYAGHKHPHTPGTPGATGHIAHTGLDVTAGDTFPRARRQRRRREPPQPAGDAQW